MTVIWPRRALRHLTALRSKIAEDSEDAAVATATRILAAVTLLENYGHLSRPGRLPSTRELVVAGTPYLIPYRVLPGRLELLAVFHGRQEWPAKL